MRVLQELTAEGRLIIEDLAQRHGVSVEAARALAAALVAGGGAQAQFNIPELGGMGQWSRGGMTMVGDMFNTALKARVDALCSELSGLLRSARLHAPPQGQSQSHGGGFGFFGSGTRAGGWWPGGLGQPSSSGSQNDLRYAVFAQACRLAVERRGRVTLYDTADHMIGGVSQQQGGEASLTFTSQHGPVRAADLEIVSAGEERSPEAAPERRENVAPPPATAPAPAPRPAPEGASATPEDDVFGKIERLADLHRKGVLNESEFEAKKAELLGRI